MENKLLEFQSRVEAIKKDSTNPFFKTSYLSLNGLLDAIKPLLNELGLVLLQPLDNINGRPAIMTVLLDDKIKLIQSEITLPDLQDPQKMGAYITYYRRYAIQSLLCLQAEDNDGESVVRQVKEDVWTMTIKSCKTLLDLQQTWLTIPVDKQTKELIALKDNLKTKLK